MFLKLIIAQIFVLSITIVFAETTMGTIRTIENGFATVEECHSDAEIPTPHCPSDFDREISELLNFATTNQCIAETQQFESLGMDIPACPDDSTQVRGLDNTHPTGGIFTLYNGENDNFIYDLTTNFLSNNPVGKVNIVIPRARFINLRTNPQLINVLNNPRVNIVPVNTMPSVDKWMQDSFQFTTINDKPAIYQLAHGREENFDMADRLACQIANECDIPYYIPPDMTRPFNSFNSLDSGGNLEVLPGGTYITGTIQTGGFGFHNPTGEVPYRTPFQELQRETLQQNGNRVLELDTSFLRVGHVDEIISTVRTNRPAPCNYAVMIASPRKAFELMEQRASIRREEQSYHFNFWDLIIKNAYAGAMSLNEDEEASINNRCSGLTQQNLAYEGHNQVLSDERVQEIYDLDCIDGRPIEEVVDDQDSSFMAIQDYNNTDVQGILDRNRELLTEELRATTGCQEPPFIEIPVYFRGGSSELPDLVNGVVQTNENGGSNVILPRTYFAPFDDYVTNELNEYGVTTTFAHDMSYHIMQGEVHCGTNSARICR